MNPDDAVRCYEEGHHGRAWNTLASSHDPSRWADAGREVAKRFVDRAHSNLVRLRAALEDLGYTFASPQSVICPPSKDIANQLRECELRYGQLPLVIKAWYERFGSIDFRQNPDQEEEGPLAHLGHRTPLRFLPFDECVQNISPWLNEDGTEVPHIPFGTLSTNSNPDGFRLPAQFFDDEFGLTERGPVTFGDWIRTVFADGGVHPYLKAIASGRLPMANYWTSAAPFSEIIPHLQSCIDPL